VTIDGERYPVTIVRTTPTSVELEIAGERVLVDHWPEHFPEPPGPVDVNGERWAVGVSRGATPGAAAPARKPETNAPASAPSRPITHEGLPIVPPMPGKVIEVRVHEGDRVRKGDVLLVLEAMKMRNELTSPVDGVVRGLAVSAGANARAKVPMLFVAPDASPS
jgi:glutaconyl-CoA/methylmalonyl-CoA decarboxylase subunit gamma